MASKIALTIFFIFILLLVPSCLFPASNYEDDIKKIEERRESPITVEPTQTNEQEPEVVPDEPDVIIVKPPTPEPTPVPEQTPVIDKPKFNMTEKNFAYFLNKDEDLLYIYNLNTSRITEEIELDSEPQEIITDSDGEYAYIAVSGADKVEIFDLSKKDVIETISTGDFPHGIVLDRRERRLIVATNNNEIQFYDIRDFDDIKKVREVDVEAEPQMLVTDYSGDWIYVSHPDDDFVSVIDMDDDSNETEPDSIIDTDVGVEGLVVSSSGKYLYTISQEEEFITIYERDDNWDNKGDIELERRSQSKRGAFAPNGLLFVTNYNLDSVSIIDTDKDEIIETIKVGDKPTGITFNGNKAWIANYGSKVITIIDSENFLTQNVTLPDSGVNSIAFG